MFEKGNLANQYFFHRQLDIYVTLGVIGSIPTDYIIDFSFDLQTESDIFILRYSDYSVVESSLIDSAIKMDIAEDIRVSNITESYILDVSDDELDNSPNPVLDSKDEVCQSTKAARQSPRPVLDSKDEVCQYTKATSDGLSESTDMKSLAKQFSIYQRTTFKDINSFHISFQYMKMLRMPASSKIISIDYAKTS